MTEIELGTWLFLNVFALSGFFAASRGWGVILVISAIIWTGLALYSFGQLDVVQTRSIPAVNTIDRNSTGNIITNSTTNAHSEKNLVINSDFNTIGWTYMIGAMVSWIWFLKILINMIQNKRGIRAYRYWSQ